jgi:uncharacterized protein YbjT (DUF2867 family)
VRALVTGGTGKLGSALVQRLHAEGWHVVAAGFLLQSGPSFGS